MSRTISKGTCQFCHGEFSKSTIGRHLASCAQRKAEMAETPNLQSGKASKKKRLFHLLVEGRDSPLYWMHLELPAETTLEALDEFLRDTWLECCGHMSAFEIGGQSYSSYPDAEFGDKSMKAKIGTVLSPGMQCSYEYDFGSTTELRLKVVAEREGETKEKSIQVLAQNDPPEIACSKCGKPATEVCCECIYEGTGWLCDACAEEHECGEEMLLPVVNSPRVGICAYGG